MTLTCALPLVQPSGFLLGQAYRSMVASTHRSLVFSVHPRGEHEGGKSNTTLTRSSFFIDLDPKFGSPSASPIQVHAVGGKLIVDATFGPPPLQDPFKWGTDVVMHSGEFQQYCSARHCPDYEWLSEQVSWRSHGFVNWRIGCEDHRRMETGNVHLTGCDDDVSLTNSRKLFDMRTQCGNVIGSLEAWLLLRSLRTLHLCIPCQSQTGTVIAQWLNLASGGNSHDGIPAGLIDTVFHSSLQGEW